MDRKLCLQICLLCFYLQGIYPQAGTPVPSFGYNGERLITFDRVQFPDDMGGIVRTDKVGRILVAGTVSYDTYHEICIARLNTDGSLDTTFSHGGKLLIPADTNIIDQTLSFNVDGRGNLLLAGQLDRSGYCIMRLDGNGMPDLSFGMNGKVALTQFNAEIQHINIYFDSQDKIILGGYSPSTGSVILRLNYEGTDDSTFGSDGKVLFPYGDPFILHTYSVDLKDRILLAGMYKYGPGNKSISVMRLTSDGIVDSTFGEIPGPLGKVFVYPYDEYDEPHADLVMADSMRKILIGITEGHDPSRRSVLIRLNEDGPVDTSFSGGELKLDKLRALYGIAIDRKGRILLAGPSEYDYNPDRSENAIYCLNDDGTTDSSFGVSGIYSDGTFIDHSMINWNLPVFNVNGISLDTSNRILWYGTEFNSNNLDFRISRLTSEGRSDDTFMGTGTVWVNGNDSIQVALKEYSEVTSLIMDHSNRLIQAGYTKNTNEAIHPEKYDNCIARLDANGNLDSSFNHTGKLILPVSSDIPIGPEIASDEENKILISGSRPGGLNREFYLQRFNENGEPDQTFGTEGTAILPIMPYLPAEVYINLDKTGRIWLFREGHGDLYDCILRFTPDGLPDTLFNGTGKLEIHDLDLSNFIYHSYNGELYILGSFPYDQTYRPKILKINDQGIADTIMQVIISTEVLDMDGHSVSIGRFYMDGDGDSTTTDDKIELEGIGSTHTSWISSCMNDSVIVITWTWPLWQTTLSRGTIDDTADTTIVSNVKTKVLYGKYYNALIADCDFVWLAGQDSSETCFVITKLFARDNQTVGFSLPDTLFVGNPPLKLNGTASSGLPIQYTCNDHVVALISNDTLTLLGEGTVTVTANQSGNGSYYAADPVSRNLVVKGNITNIRNLNSDGEITLYPNPASAILFLESRIMIRSAAVTSVDGNLLYKATMINDHHFKIDMAGYKPGCYILTIQLDDDTAQVYKVLKY